MTTREVGTSEPLLNLVVKCMANTIGPNLSTTGYVTPKRFYSSTATATSRLEGILGSSSRGGLGAG